MDSIKQIAYSIFYKTQYWKIGLVDYVISESHVLGDKYIGTLYEDRDTGSAILVTLYSEEELQVFLSYFRYKVLIRFHNGSLIRLEEFRNEFGEVFKTGKI